MNKRWPRLKTYLLHSRVVTYGKRPRRTVVLLHGIGNSGMAWREVIEQMRDLNVRIIAIDLLGFGKSLRPKNAEYDAETQAKSVRLTCLLRGVWSQDVIVVGHSMGSLVAIEYAKRYPARASSLLLCSPPLYETPHSGKHFLSGDDVLRNLYMAVQASPEQFLKLSELAMKYELINDVFNVTDKNVDSYMAALRAAIINQTSLDDIAKLKLPIHIVRGVLDPVLVSKHIKYLGEKHANITVTSIVAGHEVVGRFAKRVAKILSEMIA